MADSHTTTIERHYIFDGRDVDEMQPTDLRDALKLAIETNFRLRQIVERLTPPVLQFERKP